MASGMVKMADIADLEQTVVMGALQKLRDKRDGELRVNTRRNPRSGISEIVYVGAHERVDLRDLRDLYERAARDGVTF